MILVFSLIIFFVNLLEVMDKINGSNTPFFVIFAMAFLQIPNFLNDIVPSIILFSAIMTFFTLSLKSEITIIRSCGYSLWNIVQPVAIAGFFLGIFWVTVFGPFSILMGRSFNNFEGKYIHNESQSVIVASGGIWLKQPNLQKKDEEIVFQARKIYQESAEFGNVAIWFFDKDGSFYKKLDAQKMSLRDDKWVVSNIVMNDLDLLNVKVENEIIPTNLEEEFVMDKIVSNFQNVKLFSIFELPKLISSLKISGLQSVKFEVYFHSLLSKPILFLSMVLIACYFGINNFRDRMAIITLFVGIIFGLSLYILLSIINAIGSSRLIPVFASTWVITFICLAIGILLIYKKEVA